MTTIKLPGLIDPHVHVRDLGQSHKEDWDSCTASALAGGVTAVLAMPNTQPPIVDAAAFAQYEAAAAARARCDYGLYAGAGPANVLSIRALAPRAAGLKMYLDATFGSLKMEGLDLLVEHAANWPKESPLLAHAEESQAAAAILAAHLAGRSIHICHVSRASEIKLIAKAKSAGFDVTCEVCPHHLFLTLDGRATPGPRYGHGPGWGPTQGYIEVRPRLATQADVDALWANLDVVDCFGTDHAPHTVAEKDGPNPPPGFPLIEVALPLWLTAARDGRLTIDQIEQRMHHAPRRIFNLPEQPNTWIEVDLDQRWTVHAAAMRTRAAWSPFENWTLTGKVTKTVLRGQVAFDGDQVLARPGSGKNVRSR